MVAASSILDYDVMGKGGCDWLSRAEGDKSAAGPEECGCNAGSGGSQVAAGLCVPLVPAA